MDLKDKIMSVFWGRNIVSEKSWEELADCIVEVCEEHFMESVAWYSNEVGMLMQELEDVEIDLMLEQNTLVKFPTPGKQMRNHKWRNLK